MARAFWGIADVALVRGPVMRQTPAALEQAWQPRRSERFDLCLRGGGWVDRRKTLATLMNVSNWAQRKQQIRTALAFSPIRRPRPGMRRVVRR